MNRVRTGRTRRLGCSCRAHRGMSEMSDTCTVASVCEWIVWICVNSFFNLMYARLSLCDWVELVNLGSGRCWVILSLPFSARCASAVFFFLSTHCLSVVSWGEAVSLPLAGNPRSHTAKVPMLWQKSCTGRSQEYCLVFLRFPFSILHKRVNWSWDDLLDNLLLQTQPHFALANQSDCKPTLRLLMLISYESFYNTKRRKICITARFQLMSQHICSNKY